VGDIEPPRTGTTVTKRSDTATVTKAAATNFLVKFHRNMLDPMCLGVYLYQTSTVCSQLPQHSNKRATESETH